MFAYSGDFIKLGFLRSISRVISAAAIIATIPVSFSQTVRIQTDRGTATVLVEPDPVGMLKQLHDMNYHVMISVWPRFMPGSRYYDMLRKNGWLLVAPVTEQGATSRSVYLPAGSDWCNFWTNEKVHGGQRVTVASPIETIPVFVRAGSILPLGAPVQSTNEVQRIDKIRIYPGANTHFTLYSDDGITYAYEQGKHDITELNWDEAAQNLSHTGAPAWDVPDPAVVEWFERVDRNRNREPVSNSWGIRWIDLLSAIEKDGGKL